jgi:hypothetical protein
MADVSPAIVPDAAAAADGDQVEPAAAAASAGAADGKDGAGANASGGGAEDQGLFGGWGFGHLPDMNKVTAGFGGMFGELVDGGGGENEAAERPTGTPDGDGDGEDLHRAAADIAAGATKELEKASKLAQATLGHAAEDLGKGWGKFSDFLDDILAPGAGDKRREASVDAEDLGEDEDVQARFHSLFPDVGESEDVVDHYRCTLLQKYRCYLNNDTPEKSLAVRGRLFVCTSHLAMYIFDDGGAFDGAKFHVTVPLADVARVQKGAKSMMRVVTSAASSYIFADFESETHFAGALSLVEHMIESNVAPAGPEAAEEERGADAEREPTPGAGGGEGGEG